MEMMQERLRLLQLVTPAQTTDVAAMLGKLALHYSLGQDASHLKHLIADYIADLQEYPASVIDAACTEYRRHPDSKFFPRVGELRAICEAKFRPLRKQLADIERLIQEANGESEAEQAKPSVDAFADLVAKLKSAAPA